MTSKRAIKPKQLHTIIVYINREELGSDELETIAEEYHVSSLIYAEKKSKARCGFKREYDAKAFMEEVIRLPYVHTINYKLVT
jgi:hypothetical protein